MFSFYFPWLLFFCVYQTFEMIFFTKENVILLPPTYSFMTTVKTTFDELLVHFLNILILALYVHTVINMLLPYVYHILSNFFIEIRN